MYIYKNSYTEKLYMHLSKILPTLELITHSTAIYEYNIHTLIIDEDDYTSINFEPKNDQKIIILGDQLELVTGFKRISKYQTYKEIGHQIIGDKYPLFVITGHKSSKLLSAFVSCLSLYIGNSLHLNFNYEPNSNFSLYKYITQGLDICEITNLKTLNIFSNVSDIVKPPIKEISQLVCDLNIKRPLTLEFSPIKNELELNLLKIANQIFFVLDYEDINLMNSLSKIAPNAIVKPIYFNQSGKSNNIEMHIIKNQSTSEQLEDLKAQPNFMKIMRLKE